MRAVGATEPKLFAQAKEALDNYKKSPTEENLVEVEDATSRLRIYSNASRSGEEGMKKIMQSAQEMQNLQENE